MCLEAHLGKSFIHAASSIGLRAFPRLRHYESLLGARDIPHASWLPARSPILRLIYRKSVPPTRPVYLVFLAFHIWTFFLLFAELAKRTVVIGRGCAYTELSLADSIVIQDMACSGRLGCSSLARNRGGSTRLGKRFSCRPHYS